MEAISDTQLVAAAQAGDADSYGELFARYERRIYNYAYGITGNAEDAKDAAQEAFIRVFEALPRKSGVRDFSAYIYRTAHNVAVDTAKGRARFAPPDMIDLEIEPSVRADPERAALVRTQQEQTWQAAFALSDRHRAVLTLRELEEMSYQEIADVLDMPKNTVGVLLSRARLEFKEAFRMSSVDADTLAKECRDMLPLLSAYIDGELDTAERERVEAHVEECPLCALALEDMRESSRDYRKLIPLLPPAALGDEVLAALSKPAKTLQADPKAGKEAAEVGAGGAPGAAGATGTWIGAGMLAAVALVAGAVVAAWLLGSYAGGGDRAVLEEFESELADSASLPGAPDDGEVFGGTSVADKAAGEMPGETEEGVAVEEPPAEGLSGEILPDPAEEAETPGEDTGTESAAGAETADEEVPAAPEAPEDMTIVEDTEPPAVPQATFPADGASVSWSGVILAWASVQDESGVTYTVEIERGASVDGDIVYSPLATAEGLTATSYTHSPVSPWERWRVSAVDGAGNASGKGAWREYVVPIL